jgi:hypothetical protein
MRVLLLLLTIGCGTLFAQSQQSSPLTPEERRLVLGQLIELQSCREIVSAYEAHTARDADLDAREKATWERALDLERQATTLAHGERDLAREKAALYEDLYRSVTKRSGVGCRILRAVTMGIHRCR